MEEIKYEGQTFNFYELISLYEIEIPIIQRDYAQGRKDKTKIRLAFLNALHESIVNENELMLDFIYGSIEGKTFQPLDGQQRLTTLFLLHWYAAVKEFRLNDAKKLLLNFTYETRISSREFCNSLVANSFNIEKGKPPSLSIIDSSWFYLSWKKDPTIDAMLRTIDDIHSLFFEIEGLWEKLTEKNQSFIKFYFVNLENIGLSDDLYIKMNARGKLLTTFENFKATFEKLLRDNEWEKGVSFNTKFELKIDTIWTDFFWKHFRQNNSIDNSILNLIATLLMIRQSVNRDKRTEDRINIISQLQDDANNISSSWYTQEDFNYLSEIFDLILERYEAINKFEPPFPFFRHSTDDGFLNKIVTDNKGSSYTQKVLLYSQLEYFRRVSSINKEKYEEWMRVIRNIVSRGDIEKSGKRPDIIRSPQTFDGVIYLISELVEGCEDIYKYLNTTTEIKSTFAKEQIEEEKIKAKLFMQKPSLKPVIFELEDTDLLRGRISFVLYCIEYDNNPEDINQDLLYEVRDILAKNLASEEALSNDLRRALLATSVNNQYLFYNYWWSYWNVADCDKRKLIDNFRELEYIIHSEFRDYIKELILNMKGRSLEEFLNNFSPTEDFPKWKLRLIKEKKLLDENRSNYIAIPQDESFCYLLKSKRPRDLDGCIKIE